MTIILLNNETKTAIRTLIQKAKDNVFSCEKMQEIADNQIFDTDGFELKLPIDVETVYTHEKHPGNIEFKHLIVSLVNPAKIDLTPSFELVIAIMKEFGFVNSLETLLSYGLIHLSTHFITGITGINLYEPVYSDIESLKRKDTSHDR